MSLVSEVKSLVSCSCLLSLQPYLIFACILDLNSGCKCDLIVIRYLIDFSQYRAIVTNTKAADVDTSVAFVFIIHRIVRLNVAKLFLNLAELIADHFPAILHDFGPEVVELVVFNLVLLLLFLKLFSYVLYCFVCHFQFK